LYHQDPLAECAVADRKGLAKPLKTRPRPLNAIDVVLKRMAVTGGLSIFLRSGSPGLVVSRGYAWAEHLKLNERRK